MDPTAAYLRWASSGGKTRARAARDLRAWLARGGFEPNWTPTEKRVFFGQGRRPKGPTSKPPALSWREAPRKRNPPRLSTYGVLRHQRELAKAIERRALARKQTPEKLGAMLGAFNRTGAVAHARHRAEARTDAQKRRLARLTKAMHRRADVFARLPEGPKKAAALKAYAKRYWAADRADAALHAKKNPAAALVPLLSNPRRKTTMKKRRSAAQRAATARMRAGLAASKRRKAGKKSRARKRRSTVTAVAVTTTKRRKAPMARKRRRKNPARHHHTRRRRNPARHHRRRRNPGAAGGAIKSVIRAAIPAAVGGLAAGFLDARVTGNQPLVIRMGAKIAFAALGGFVLRKNPTQAAAFMGSMIGSAGYEAGVRAGGGMIATSKGQGFKELAAMAAEDEQSMGLLTEELQGMGLLTEMGAVNPDDHVDLGDGEVPDLGESDEELQGFGDADDE